MKSKINWNRIFAILGVVFAISFIQMIFLPHPPEASKANGDGKKMPTFSDKDADACRNDGAAWADAYLSTLALAQRKNMDISLLPRATELENEKCSENGRKKGHECELDCQDGFKWRIQQFSKSGQ